MRIVFWQNMMAFHQSAHIRALAAMPGCEVTWVVQEIIRPERAALGWPSPDPGRAQVIVDPDEQTVQTLARERPEESVHIFSGHRGYSTVERGLAACLSTKATLGYLAERQDGRGWKGLARLLRARRDWRALRDRISFVLAIGAGAPEWYARCGYPRHRIYPYGYFMESPAPPPTSDTRADGPVNLVYIGSLLIGKGVDVLLRALAQLEPPTWRLGVVGDGPERRSLERFVWARGLEDQVLFHGVLPHDRAMTLLADSDLLILPSRRKDGWGAVVSEALMRGVPAVCTEECGASALLGEPWRGEVVRAGSVPALGMTLQRWIARGPRTPAERQRIIDWSQCITGESAAAYLLAVVHHVRGEGPRPEVPW